MFNASGNYLINEHKVYKVGIYVRLPREDETKGNAHSRANGNSESIQNQLDYLNDYAHSQGWNVVSEYIDDGYSGGSFDRPEFNRMLSDIEEGKINLVLVKDLSRLGREVSQTAYYTDFYFPERNVRFIALNDGIDTFAESTGNDMAGLRMAFNDMFLRDTSKKIKTSLNMKKRQGLFVAPFAPYGYIKDKHNKHKLIIDETAALVVRRIFELFIGGMSMFRIAKTLNEEGIPSTSVYKRQNVEGYGNRGRNDLWEQNTIRAILKSQVYIGHMVQGKQFKVSYKSKKLKNNPQEKWIIVNDTHEPIIDKETFDLAQSLLSKNQAAKDISKDGSERLLNGLLYCGKCGSRIYMTKSRGKWHTICSRHRRFGNNYCLSHRVWEKMLNDYVIAELQAISKKLIDSEALANKLKDGIPKREAKDCEQQLNRVDKQITDLQNQLVAAYQDKVKGLLTDGDFLLIRDTINQQREELANKRESIAAKLQKKQDGLHHHEQAIQQLLAFETPNKTVVRQLVERITINHYDNGDKEIIVEYTFPNPLEG
jgi:DNA invertase Pin-like site-specific DNA recombinase